MKRVINLFVLAAVLVAPALALVGCNTMEGVGRDVERAGEWTQEKAK